MWLYYLCNFFVSAKAVHFVSTDKEPFLDVWYCEITTKEQFYLGPLNLISRILEKSGIIKKISGIKQEMANTVFMPP